MTFADLTDFQFGFLCLIGVGAGYFVVGVIHLAKGNRGEERRRQ